MDRSTLINTQYRPISTSETSTNDAMSVRAVRDLALGINNAFARACSPHLSLAWPYGATSTVYNHAVNDTNEHLGSGLFRGPGVFVGPRGHYTHAAWSVFGWLSPGSNDCTVRLYSCERYYRGASTIDATSKAMFGAYSSSSQTIASETGVMKSSGDFALEINPDFEGMTYFLLTVQFGTADAANGVDLLHLAVTLQHSELAVAS